MPVIRAELDPLDQLHDQLVQQVARELAGEHTPSPPVIYEIPIQPSSTLHVIVVWDQWADLSPQERSSILIDAYEVVDQKQQTTRAARITIAMGTTWEEANRLKLLPYSVEPNYRKGEVDHDAVAQAMINVGGVSVGKKIYLRFPSKRQAEAVYHQLSQQLPDAHWAISEIVGTFED